MAARQPIITVSGHVDSGKTSFLDAIRNTKVAEREAGKITQHIGATEVPREAILQTCKELLEKSKMELKLPGLLFIDTPGHEAFTNLRRRGGSIADLAVLMVDIQEGFKPQTREALEILKGYKVPFVVAANKVDRVSGWNSYGEKSITACLAKQNEKTLKELDDKVYKILGSLAEYGINSDRFDRVYDITQQVMIVPISAREGVGIPEMLLYLTGLAQKYLSKVLETEMTGPGKGTVLEVKEEKGLGKTLDVILYDGVVKAGDTIIVGGANGPVEGKVKAILKPKPLDEIRDPRDKFTSVKEVTAAAGIKIAAPGLEDALAGAPLYVVHGNSEELRKKVAEEVEQVQIKTDKDGVIIKADALGSLEAIAKIFQDAGVQIKSANVGNVSKQDILEAKSIRDSNRILGVVFAFNNKVDELATQAAIEDKVKVFESRVIYRLLEEYKEWVEQEKEAEKKEEMYKLILPAKIRILPGCLFRNAKPAIVGVRVDAGMIRPDYPLIKETGEVIGRIKGIKRGTEAKATDKESRGGREVMKVKTEETTNLQELKKNEEAAISIDGPIVGRHIFENDVLYTQVPRDHALTLKTRFKEFLSQEELKLLEFIRDIKVKES